MQTRHAVLAFKLFAVFIAVLIAEYILSGIYFRLVKNIDFLVVDLLCGLSAIGLCYWKSRKAFKFAKEEKIPTLLVASLFIVLCFLVGCFFRFSIQLANGLLDYSDPETHVVSVNGKNVSSFGGSLKDGPNPIARLLYFSDWDNDGWNCELLTPPAFYYTAQVGTRLEVSVRKGFFHLAWIQDYRMLNSPFGG
jgi:hypothetical protein